MPGPRDPWMFLVIGIVAACFLVGGYLLVAEIIRLLDQLQ